jgi:hypothetical protein
MVNKKNKKISTGDIFSGFYSTYKKVHGANVAEHIMLKKKGELLSLFNSKENPIVSNEKDGLVDNYDLFEKNKENKDSIVDEVAKKEINKMKKMFNP